MFCRIYSKVGCQVNDVLCNKCINSSKKDQTLTRRIRLRNSLLRKKLGFISVKANRTEIYEYVFKSNEEREDKSQRDVMQHSKNPSDRKSWILIGGYRPIRRLKGTNGHTYFNYIDLTKAIFWKLYKTHQSTCYTLVRVEKRKGSSCRLTNYVLIICIQRGVGFTKESV
jgi:hypothetical protein